MRAMHEFFFENLRNPARIRRAGLMRQFRPDQVYSTLPGYAFYKDHPKAPLSRSTGDPEHVPEV
jgi:hypothetical protein